jgi:hypothetical protein
MNKTDSLPTRGRVKIMAYGPTGQLLDVRQGPNLIVTSGRTAVAAALAGGTGHALAQIGFGEDGTPTDPSDSGLTNEVRKSFISASASANSVELQAELTASEGNGQTFREVGLYTANGDLFARHVIGAFDKTNIVRLLVVWTIYS